MAAMPVEQESPEPPVDLRLRALENLSFIRDTMQRASVFTAVPGWGMVMMGVVAFGGGYIAALRLSEEWWIYSWMWVAIVGCALGTGAMLLKAQRIGQAVWTGLGRRAIFNFSPAILAGLMLSEVAYELRLDSLMPVIWLMLYGVAVCGGGAFSVRIVPLLGLCFILMALVAYWASFFPALVAGPFYAVDLVLLAGFGGLHIVFGLIIAHYHGG